MITPLSPQRITALCQPGARQVAIEVVAETGSTNADLLARLDRLDGPTLLVAELQTAGRGRAGRVWHAACGASLTFSLAWKFRRPLQALVGLPLAVGVALAEALALLGVAVRLKWPNDVLKDGNKLAGILIETGTVKHAQQDESWAVIGIGLNLALPETLATQIGRPAAAAPALASDREALLAALLNRLSPALLQFDESGFEGFMEHWNRLHAYAGQPVVLVDRGQVMQEGKALGVDQSGRLLLDTASGQVAIMAGDVSLRVMEEG